MNNSFNKKDWSKYLNNNIDKLSLSEFSDAVNAQYCSAQQYEIENILSEAFYVSLAKHNKEFAKFIVDEFYNERSFDTAMMNYRITKLDYDALVIYSDLIDMSDYQNEYDENNEPIEDCDFTVLFAAQGDRKSVLRSIDAGMKANANGFFTVSLKNGLIEEAKFYKETMGINISEDMWDKLIRDLGYYESWDKMQPVFEYLSGPDFEHPMAGYNESEVLAELLSNTRLNAANFCHSFSVKEFNNDDIEECFDASTANMDSITWLLDKGWIPEDSSEQMLRILAHTKESEGVITRIIDLIGHDNAPWGDMLLGAMGSGGIAKERVEFLSSINKFTDEEVKKAYSKAMSYNKESLSDFIVDKFNIKPSSNELLSAIELSHNPHNSSCLINMSSKINIKEDDRVLDVAVRKLVRNGGVVNLVDSLLKNGCNPYAGDKSLLELVSRANRDDLKSVFNKYLDKEDRLELNTDKDLYFK